MALTRRLALAAVLLVACGSGTKKPPPRPPVAVADDVTDPKVLLDDLAATIRESTIALSNGYDDQYLDGLARDARLTIVDVNPRDVVAGFDVAACRVRRLFPDLPHQIDMQSLEVDLAADRSAAWSFAHLSYRVLVDRRRATVPLRATALYERHEGRWIKVMEHVSYGVADARAIADASAGKSAEPRRMPAGSERGAAVDEVRKVLEQAILGDAQLVAADGRALLVGSDPARLVRGEAVAQVATPGAVYGGATVRRSGDLRVQLTRKGTVAWGAGNLMVAGKGFTMPVRATWVVEKRNGAWKIVQTHLAVPVGRERLALEVFGEADEKPQADR